MTFPKGHAEHTDKVQLEIKKNIFKWIGYGPVTAVGFTVSPTLLPSAFYRECHSHKIPQIHCAMVHTALLYVVHAKLLSISTWKKAATLRARVTEYYKATKSKNLNRRLTENRMFWHRWIFVPQRARPIFYSGDLCSAHALIPSTLFFCTLPLPFSHTLSFVLPLTWRKPRGTSQNMSCQINYDKVSWQYVI